MFAACAKRKGLPLPIWDGETRGTTQIAPQRLSCLLNAENAVLFARGSGTAASVPFRSPLTASRRTRASLREATQRVSLQCRKPHGHGTAAPQAPMKHKNYSRILPGCQPTNLTEFRLSKRFSVLLGKKQLPKAVGNLLENRAQVGPPPVPVSEKTTITYWGSSYG